MFIKLHFIISAIIFLTTLIHAAPGEPSHSSCHGKITAECCPDCFGTLPQMYTLTAVKIDKIGRHDREYDGLKVEGSSFSLFVSKVAGYCPFTGDQASLCPNGTDTAFVGTLGPLSEVPGGQDTYVNEDGLMAITVQHSHSFPPGPYPYYYGWTWTPLQLWPPRHTACPTDNSMYNCDPPTGLWTFKAPNATVGGVMACPNEYNPSSTSVYAVTPAFNRTDCVDLSGLGTHNYTGPNPPVWAY